MANAGLAIFTVCSNNYVPMAKVLLESAHRHHPDATLFLCLADEPLADDGFYPQRCTVIRSDALEIPNFRDFAFRYDVMEFNTALKPFMFRHLLARGYRRVIYLDADIEIYAPLKPVLDLLDQGASFVLTPHLTKPAERDAYPDDLGIMRAGVYNLGFLGVGASEETDRILRWWSRKLQFDCTSDQDRGIFVDQKFMDLVPGFAEHARILRDTTCNVAYWNLDQRELGRSGDAWFVDDRPLCFFHFSGIRVNDTTRLTRYSNAFRDLDGHEPLATLASCYLERLRANGHGSIPNATYSYGRFASGTPIPAQVRQMYRQSHVSWSLGDPFETYEEYLHLPCVPRAGSRHLPVTRFMKYLYATDESLRQRFNLETLEGAEAYVRAQIGTAQTREWDRRLVETALLRSGRNSLRAVTRKLPARLNAGDPLVNVIGYFRLAVGVGESGRKMLMALDDAGVDVRGLPVHFGSDSRAIEVGMDTHFVEEATAPIQLFNINADQLPRTIEHLQPMLRKDAYRIVMPFCELEEFPQAWLAAFDLVDEVWAPTRYVQSILAPHLSIPVVYMPSPLTVPAPPDCSRSEFGFPDDAFLFFFAFDYFSYVERKNPMALVRAFKRAFASADPARPVKLVIKTLNADAASEESDALREALRDEPDIILVDLILDREKTLQLINVCDAVASLHRSEGLGLIVAEAMALGKPVIATDYSATTELVTPSTGWPVDFKLVAVGAGKYPYSQGQVWAEADEEHAAWQMREVVNNPLEAKRRADSAKAFLNASFGADICARHLRKRVAELQSNGGAMRQSTEILSSVDA